MESSNVFFALKEACNAQTKYKSITDLTIGVYKIDRFELCATTYGNRAAIWVNGYRLFLPTRFNTVISSAEQVKELNMKKYVLIYKGKDVHKCNRVLLDFQLMDEYIQTTNGMSNHSDIGMSYDTVG